MTFPLHGWLLATLAILLAVALPLFRSWRGPRAVRALKLFLFLFVSLLLLTLGELGFRYFVGASDGFGITLAHRNWVRWNWPGQFNSLHYRDVEPTAENYAGRRVLFVAGDSLVQGYGIAHAEDIFSNVIQRGLPADWRVANIAKEGWETPDYATAMEGFPLEPDAIVLSYFPNDITTIAIHGKVEGFRDLWPTPPAGAWGELVARSYLLNYFYWRAYRARGAGGLGAKYMRFLENAFRNELVWQVHTKQIQRVIDFARAHDAPLFVVVTPFLQAVEATSFMTDKVVAYLREQGVPTLDMAPLLRGREPASLVVNANDAHPNARLHAELGARILEGLRSSGALE